MGIFDWFKSLRQSPNNPYANDPQGEIPRWRKALSDFGYPYDLVSGAEAEEAYMAAKRAGAASGFVPVILMPGNWHSDPLSPDDRRKRTEQILQAAGSGKQILEGLVATLQEDFEADPECGDPAIFDQLNPREQGVRPSALSLRALDTKNPDRLWDEVAIVRVPAAAAHELPAYFDWGGWNSVPMSEELVAIARYWQEAYGAELAVMGHDTLQFTVSRPPADHASAVALLKEHYAFDQDGFEFDRDVLEEAAADLRGRQHWFFWWD